MMQYAALRNLRKTNMVNDGTRTLSESIVVWEVGVAFDDFVKATKDEHFVLIGGLALSFYVKPRTTTDVDVLFLSDGDIPASLDKFNHHSGAFEHKMTGVEVEVLSPTAINLPQHIAEHIFATARKVDGVKIASPAGLVVSKLGRFNRQDQADIESLLKYEKFNIDEYHVPPLWEERFRSIEATL